jgi:hypothetical protein
VATCSRTVRLLGAVVLLLGLTAIVTAGAALAGRSKAAVGGRTWTIEPTPDPVGAEISVLSSVACSSGRACTAVGSSAASLSSFTLPLAERWDGNSWRIQPAPAPKGTSDTLFGVSCPSARACIAVGSAFHSAGRRQTALTEIWNGRRWRVQSVPTITAPSSLYAVSCRSASACVAVGHTLGAPQHAIVERWDGKAWRTEAIPQLAKDTTLVGASCPQARACTAVGWNNATGKALPLAMSWNGNSWQVQVVPLPRQAPAGLFDAVSCTSTKACTATGTDFSHPGGPTLAERWNGKTWRVQRTPNPANLSLSSSEVALNGVSCTSAKACTAIGEYTPDHAAAYFIESWNGKRWRLEPAPHPPGFAHGALLGISCASARCAAVGAYAGKVHIQDTLAMTN